MKLTSPLSGAMLTQEGHALCAPGERWPIVDDIAFLRADRLELAKAALDCLDAGDAAGAAVVLLADQDGWARAAPPSLAARQAVVANQQRLNFREAMDLLALGPVAAYFAHRWSDPTFLSGLALAQSYWQPKPSHVLELACGAGHYLASFGAGAVGADLVFAKLWLARHFVAPYAALLCFDAVRAWPVASASFDMVFCHDAFYFLPDKAFVAAQMQRVGKRVLIGHMHNALVDNLSAGQPLPPQGYAALFQNCVLFDDLELTNALLEIRPPVAALPENLATAAALALVWPGATPGVATGALTDVQPGRTLRRNPLYQHGQIAWPSERYAREYGPLASYPLSTDAPEDAIAGQSPAIDAMARRRVLLDLPDRW